MDDLTKKLEYVLEAIFLTLYPLILFSEIMKRVFCHITPLKKIVRKVRLKEIWHLITKNQKKFERREFFANYNPNL